MWDVQIVSWNKERFKLSHVIWSKWLSWKRIMIWRKFEERVQQIIKL
jgi:hypothetical protein